MNDKPIPASIRSADQTLALVQLIDPEHNVSLQPHDVTGDGKPETFCNVFVRTLFSLMEAEIPPMLANQLYDWFRSDEGYQAGFRPISMSAAAPLAEAGLPVVGVWRNTAGHGHVVAVVPARDENGKPIPGALHSAQAGASNWNNRPLGRAGVRPEAYSYYVHDPARP